jgi:hypothetical protein
MAVLQRLTSDARTEHAQQAKKRQADLQVPVLLQSNAALAEPVQIPGMRYLEINITGRRFNLHLVRQLSWSCFMYTSHLLLPLLTRVLPRCLTSSATDPP